MGYSEDLSELIARHVADALRSAARGKTDTSRPLPAFLLHEELLRNEIVRTARELQEMGFFPGTSGNISARINEQEFLITPSGVNKSQLTAAQIVKVDCEGRWIAGEGTASSEAKMHLYSYSERPDIGAIVHAHPPFSTGFAAAEIPLDKPVLPEVILILGRIPLVEYGTPSTWEVPQSLAPYVKDHHAFLLSHHGTLTFGRDLSQAAHRTDTLELFAKVIVIARMLGGEKLLTEEQLQRLAETR